MVDRKRAAVARKLFSTASPREFPALDVAQLLSTRIFWFVLEEFGSYHNYGCKFQQHRHNHFTFHAVRCFFHIVKAVNDAAKRGKKLHTDYATILTDDKQRSSVLILTLKPHRQEYSTQILKNLFWHKSTKSMFPVFVLLHIVTFN